MDEHRWGLHMFNFVLFIVALGRLDLWFWVVLLLGVAAYSSLIAIMRHTTKQQNRDILLPQIAASILGVGVDFRIASCFCCRTSGFGGICRDGSFFIHLIGLLPYS